MRTRKKNLSNKPGFSLIEVLVTLSIIAILVGLLVPALNMARDMAMNVVQQTQLRTIGTVLETFKDFSGYNDYPPSNNNVYGVNTGSDNYTGSQKLAEALIGMDGFGWHPDSAFATHGMEFLDGTGIHLYYPSSYPSEYPTQADIDANLHYRVPPYFDIDKVGAVQLKEIYGSGFLTSKLFDPEGFVLTDVYGTVKHKTSGNKIGMPILYYKASSAGTVHNVGDYDFGLTDHHDFYYEFHDNNSMLWLGTQDGDAHPMYDNWQWFYEKTTNPNITSPPRPYNDQSFILQSAGPDGLYGTPDDVFNF
jgi:prepilin-type N-terminal cleavage/methylation domain-containing protein